MTLQALRYNFLARLLVLSRWNAAAIAIFLVGVVALVAELLPERAATRQTEQLVAQNNSSSVRALSRPKPDTPEQDLQQLRSLMPAIEGIPEALATIHAAAQARGLDLPEGQLKLMLRPGSQIAQYQMTFPLQGSYTATRDFVRDAMSKLPTLALDQMTFQRGDAGSATTDVRIQFTLFVLALSNKDRT